LTVIARAPYLLAFLLQVAAPAAPQDPPLEAAVRRFFETQEKEDVKAYLSLWSADAQRPRPEQLQYIFDSGDDRFTDIRITRIVTTGTRARVRVEAYRERTRPPRPDGSQPAPIGLVLHVGLTFEKEGDDWKLLREGPPADDLASAIMEAATTEEADAVLAADADLDGPPLLAAFARLGGAAIIAQNYPRAQAIFEHLVRNARRTGHRKEEAEGLHNIANALYYQRRFPEALAAYEQRFAIERERGNDEGVAASLAGMATIRYSLGEYTDALVRYRQALAIQERLDDVSGVAFSTLSIGNITYIQGDFPAAIVAYRRSLELHRTMSHADGESLALEGLGRVYTAQGDYSAALDVFNTVLQDPRIRSNRGRLGSVAQNLGDVHFRLANLEAARRNYEDSRGHFEASKDMASAGRVMQALALTELVAGRHADAEDLYRRSGTTCAAVEDKECAAGATSGFAYAQSAQEKFFDSAVSYRRAISAFNALGHRENAARAEIGLSQALLGAGDVSGALEAAASARRTAVVIENDDVLWRALTAEARAVRKSDDTERALGIAGAAVAAVERLQALALDRPGASVPADAAAALTTFAILQAATGDAAGAFATSEKLRSLDIRAGLATNEREITRGMTADEREEERALAAELSTGLARLTREKGLPKPDPSRVSGLENAVAEATETRRLFMRRLFDRLPELLAWRGLAPPCTAADAAPLLDASTILLSFVLDDHDALVLVASRQEPGEPTEAAEGAPAGDGHGVTIEAHLTPVKRRELAGRIAGLQQPAVQGDTAAWRTAMSEVASIIPPAVSARLAAASRILIIPHDVLWRVPFEAMPLEDGFLIDRAIISVGGTLAALRRSSMSGAAASGSLLAVASPELEPSRIERLRQVAPSWVLRKQEDADEEARRITGVYDPAQATSVAAESATEESIRLRAQSAAVLHLAAPFRINAASPLFSPILLSLPAPADPAGSRPVAAEGAARTGTPAADAPRRSPAPSTRNPSDDGSLELREILNLTLQAGVTILSDGAATSMRDGAAAADVLQWGWLASGVPSVLLSRWAAPEGSDALLLAEFHRRLLANSPPADALRKAQLAVQSNEATSAPAHWAGWMLLGAR
jgi:tetratricopeptide (TPR) repeat protein/CHAT domain-containing protein